MKKKLLLMAACLGAMFAFTACSSKDDGNTLTVLNYGKYIESSVLDAFEEETGIHVNYEEYVNPEEMYTKYKSGAIDYDVICTSDYMVERLINEGEAKEINFDKIPLSKNLDDSYFEFSKALPAGKSLHLHMLQKSFWHADNSPPSYLSHMQMPIPMHYNRFRHCQFLTDHDIVSF